MADEFNIAVTQYRRQIYSFALYYLRNREEAEDIVQEVLIKLWKNFESLKREILQPWIIRVTRNACFDCLRKRQKYQSVVQSEFDGAELADVPHSAPSPGEALEAKEIRSQIDGAIDKLPEPYKSIFILREIHDMKYLDICETLELPVNTVKVYLYRSRRMVRTHLKEGNHDA